MFTLYDRIDVIITMIRQIYLAMDGFDEKNAVFFQYFIITDFLFPVC